jgi:hypothetical protein
MQIASKVLWIARVADKTKQQEFFEMTRIGFFIS